MVEKYPTLSSHPSFTPLFFRQIHSRLKLVFIEISRTEAMLLVCPVTNSECVETARVR